MLPEIDYRIQGLPHSTVEEEDNTRKEVVNKVIHQFETHSDREALIADLRQNQAYNPLSEKSKNGRCVRSLPNLVPSLFHTLDDRYLVMHLRNLPVSRQVSLRHETRCWRSGERLLPEVAQAGFGGWRKLCSRVPQPSVGGAVEQE